MSTPWLKEPSFAAGVNGGVELGEAWERRRIRRAIAPALRKLVEAIGEQDRTGTPHQTRRLFGYVDDIRTATRAPRPARAKGSR